MQLLWKNLIEEAQKELSISSHLTAFMRNTNVTQLLDKPFNKMPIRALNCVKTYIPVAPPRVENG